MRYEIVLKWLQEVFATKDAEVPSFEVTDGTINALFEYMQEVSLPTMWLPLMALVP